MIVLYPVTIIIPLYMRDQQGFDHAKEAIESAVANSCYISIWDDTDHTDESAALAATLRKLASTVPERITWNGDGINRGVSYARNKAVEYAQTDLILPLDGDDRLASNAVSELLKVYNRTPLYPDIRKFGHEEVEHYRLLDFHCDHIFERVGLSSVCVFHERRHWQQIGGWREDLNYYEDGEYNARLFGTFCGKNLHKPLYHYRQHHQQKTKLRAKESAQQVRRILSIIKEHGNMACCGRGRKATKQGVSVMSQIQVVQSTSVDDLPLQQGDRVLALYTAGKGKGKHYKGGPKTGFSYRVEYGKYYYVFHEDARLDQEDPAKSPFIRVVREVKKGQRTAVKTEEKAPVLEYEPDPVTLEEVVEGDSVEEYEDEEEEYEDDDFLEDEEELDLVDIIQMPWNQFKHYEFSPEEAKMLLQMEKRGKARVKFLNKLEREAKA